MMKKISAYFFSLILLSILVSACEQDDPEVEYAAVGKAAGHWWVTYQVETSPGVLEEVIPGHNRMLTYNTADNAPNQIWLDDQGNFWPFQLKATYNGADMSFTATNAPSIVQSNGQDITATITEGKVILGSGKSKTGLATDSIYFRAEFSDDPGTIYIVSGHRRTGLAADEY